LRHFLCIAIPEGATSDKSTIKRSWLEQAAKNFNPSTSGARIWLEHFRSVMPDSPFKAYGDVLAVKTDKVEINGQKKLALLAQVEPTPKLIAMNKAKQKVYTSIEIDDSFADTGEAYIVGLAVTDSPASLGTNVLAISLESTGTVFIGACVYEGDELSVYPPMQRDINVSGVTRIGGREHHIDTMDIYS